MENKLFDDFTGISRDEWLAKITTDLRGKPLEGLNWEAAGLTGSPVYTKEDLPADLPNLENASRNPEIYGARYWVNYQLIQVTDEKTANTKALEALNAGADGLIFKVRSIPDFASLLKDIELAYCHVSFEDATGGNGDLAVAYFNYLKENQADLDQIKGFYNGGNRDQLHAQGKTFFKSINIDSDYGYLSQRPVIEMAMLLSRAVDSFDALTDQEISARHIFEQTQFQLTVRSSYFTEIAKFRAMRALVTRFAQAYEVTLSPNEVSLFAKSSDWSEPLDDMHSHMLRATTQAMSAIIGGADAICIQPFYPVFEKEEGLAERAARNISTILKEESYLAKVVDPTAGSYFVESLTQQLTDQAWQLFLAFEAEGGYKVLNNENIESLFTQTVS